MSAFGYSHLGKKFLRFSALGIICMFCTQFIHVAHAANLEYRYVKWQVTKKKSAATNCGGTYCIQASEFVLLLNGSVVSWPVGTTASNPGGQNPNNEAADKMIDGTAAKWLDKNFNGNPQVGSSNLVIDTGVGHTVIFNGYKWATGGDAIERDPISWNLYGSNDGSSYTLISTETDQPITDSRSAYTSDYSTDDTAAPVLSSVSPADNATGISATANLVLNFSEAVQGGTGSVVLKKTSDDSTVETITANNTSLVSGNGTTQITINPAAILMENTGYYVIVNKNAFQDNAGNDYQGFTASTTWNFTSADVTAPAAPSGFAATASGTSVFLSWANPVDSDFSSVTIRRSASAYPINTSAGSSVFSGSSATNDEDAGLSDGLYYYSIFALDTVGNVSTAAHATATVDTVTRPPTLTAPASSALVTFPFLTLNYFLPESPAAGSVSLNFDDGGSNNITLTMNDATSTDVVLNLADISANTSVISATSNVVPAGIYTVTLAYSNIFGLTTATAVSTNVAIRVPVSSSSSSQAQTVSRGGAARTVTMEAKLAAAHNRFGSSSSVSSSTQLSAADEPSFFTDVTPSHWFFADIETLRSKDIISGYKDANGKDKHQFGPGDLVTRGEFAKMLIGITRHAPSSTGAAVHWAEPYVREARTYGLGIYMNEKLNLDTKTTRGEVVHTILEAYGISLAANPQSDFLDFPKDHSYAKDVLAATALGIISGDDQKNTVRLDDPVNRAEIAKILIKVSSHFAPAMKLAFVSAVGSSASSSSLPANEPHASAPVSAAKKMRTVATEIANVRSDARINSGILWVAKKGMQMEVLDIVAKDWAHIRVSDGNQGYVWVHHLQ